MSPSSKQYLTIRKVVTALKAQANFISFSARLRMRMIRSQSVWDYSRAEKSYKCAKGISMSSLDTASFKAHL